MRNTILWESVVWYKVPGYDAYYASEDGRILSMAKKHPRILTPIKSEDGHLYVYMYDKRGSRKVWVHRAVLSAYCGKDEKSLICRHLDDNPSNNHVSNLAWGTRQQNADDRKKNKGFLKGENAPSSKLKPAQVMEIRRRYAKGEPASALSIEFGVSRNTINRIARGSAWSNLPIVPVEVKHSSRRKTPVAKDHVKKFIAGGKKYAESRKIPRKLVECACGCGTLIETPDSKGRDRRFAHGHNSRSNHWRWSKNGENDKDRVV